MSHTYIRFYHSTFFITFNGHSESKVKSKVTGTFDLSANNYISWLYSFNCYIQSVLDAVCIFTTSPVLTVPPGSIKRTLHSSFAIGLCSTPLGTT